ncbi:HK97-gp10 family putative phage morphogenesis protein [Anoxybacillus sp. ST4]|uniref:HK97-gp10 family putative phage morphogenesis protein n=1 Tax=Anoxybacillus sp. ST4 TaxID=2864181 RepID=UPI001C63F334|nr:HK97-gp10 family putative phage morphogenesis protein [Anoxybacillus sp. ST4]MBW7649789.1 HK97 gp10 family phage protein [Anoxybacillus sp. ST4]
MSRFQEEIQKMRERREKTIKEIAIFVEAEAKLRAPVKTGHLRRSISHETENSETQSKAYIGTNVEYAPYVEFGVASKNIKPQPYLRPAIEENKDKIKEIIEKGMNVQ